MFLRFQPDPFSFILFCFGILTLLCSLFSYLYLMGKIWSQTDELHNFSWHCLSTAAKDFRYHRFRTMRPIYLPRLMANNSMLKQTCCCVLPGKNSSHLHGIPLPSFLATWFLVVYSKTIHCTLILSTDLENSGKTTLEKWKNCVFITILAWDIALWTWDYFSTRYCDRGHRSHIVFGRF